MTKSERTALYRLFDTNDHLLYVGISHDPRKRSRQHAKQHHWWHLVALREFEWFATRGEAVDAERRAIRDETPRFNRKNGDKPGMHEERRRKASVSVRAAIAGSKAEKSARSRGASTEEAKRENRRVQLQYKIDSGLHFANLTNTTDD